MTFRTAVWAALFAAVFAGAASAATPTASDPYPDAEVILPANAVRGPLIIPPGSPESVVEPLVISMVGDATTTTDFAFLDKKANEYRRTMSRTPMGGYELSLIYAAFEMDDTGDRAADEHLYQQLEKKALLWAAQFPDSPAPHIVYAQLLIAHGWLYRGIGLADAVTPEGWARFHDYVGRAERYLDAHKKLASVDPEWYVMRLRAALAADWDRPRYEALLSEALDRYPYYNRIYYEAISHYLPQWGGDIDALDDFVDDAVRRTHKQYGTQMYARIYNKVSGCHCDRLFAGTRATWGRMLGSFTEIANKYPDPWLFDEMFYFACEAGDRYSAVRAYKHIERDEQRSGVWLLPDDFKRCKAWVLDPKGKASPLQLLQPLPKPASGEAVRAPTVFDDYVETFEALALAALAAILGLFASLHP